MGDSWIVDNLNAALNTWNGKLAEIWQLLTESPQTFRGGQVWSVMVGIHGALQAIGYGLLVLFFAIGVVKTCGSFVEVKRPEHALKLFIRFALAKAAVTYGLELMQAVFSIVQGTVSTVITQSGTSGMNSTTLPQELVDAINNVGFWDSIPLWAVTLIGGLLITVLSFVMILTVYGRMFSLWMYAAIAPIPLATFAGEPTANVGKNFIRSYAGVCLQGLVIALSCVIFSALAASPPSVDTSESVVTAVWTYVAELTFNLLVLVGAIKGCDRIVKEIMGLWGASMEIKIPKEVREYHETIFFGLNTRQFVCSMFAVGVAVAMYFLLQPVLGTEEIGWVCILAAAPFAVCGFFTYHGMTAEQLLWAWCKSELLCLKRLVFRSDSYYYTAMQPAMQAGLRKKKQCKKRKRGKPVDKQHHKNQERRA